MLSEITSIKAVRLQGMPSEIGATIEGEPIYVVGVLDRWANTAPRLGGHHKVRVEATKGIGGTKLTFTLSMTHSSTMNIGFDINKHIVAMNIKHDRALRHGKRVS